MQLWKYIKNNWVLEFKYHVNYILIKWVKTKQNLSQIIFLETSLPDALV